MKKELNIINGGLEPKRPPNIVSEMAKAAQERQKSLPEPLKIEKEPDVVKPEYILSVKLYNDELRAVSFDNVDDRLIIYNKLYGAMCNKSVIDIKLDNMQCIIRGDDIQHLRYKLPESVKE